MRKSTVLWLGLAAFCGTVLFHTSQKVTDGRQHLAVLLQDTQKEEESLRVLQAEWSYLNQPDRLEKLASQYLPLDTLKGRQFTKIEDIGKTPASVVAAAKEAAPAPEIVAAAPADTLAAQDDEAPVVSDTLPAPSKKEILATETAHQITATEVAKITPVKSTLTAKKPEPMKVVTTKSDTPSPWKPASKPTQVTSAAPSDTRGFNDVMKSLGVR